jgi:hypothetical protein
VALGIAPLTEGQVSRRHFICGAAIGTLEDHHFFHPSRGDTRLSEVVFCLYTPEIRAFKFGDRRIKASRMLLDNGKPYWLSTFPAGILHK